MYLRPQVLSLITTHQCTAACDHCCFECTPKITKAIPIKRLHSLIDEAASIRTIRTIVFTGGECFLLNKDLDDLILKATNFGLITRCVTNGYWGTSLNAAIDRSLRLKKSGLKEINFSTGTFHEKYVSKEKVLNATLACLKQKIRAVLNIEVYKNDTFDTSFFFENEELIEFQKIGLLTIQRNVWMQNGGAENFEYKREHTRFIEKNKTPCTTVLNVITVNPDQNLIACCGLHLEKIPDLKLGSVANATIVEVLEQQKPDLLKIWLHVEGPEKILDFIKKYIPDYKLPENSVHVCETCLHLYTDKTAQKTLLAHYKEVEDAIMEKYYSTLALAHIANQNIKEVPNIGYA